DRLFDFRGRWRRALMYDPAALISHPRDEGESLANTFEKRVYFDVGAAVYDTPGGDTDAPPGDPRLFRKLVEPNVPVNTRTGIPPAVLAEIAHAHRKNVISGRREMRCQIIGKWRVAIRVNPQVMSIQPHVAVHVDPFEQDLDAAIRWHFQPET